MKNNLFNQTLLKKYSQKFKPTHKQKEIIREYIEKVENGDFEGETKNYFNFFDMILKEVLGYTRDNIDPDSKMDDGPGRVEFALQKDNSDRFMVVELKGQKVDLDKKQTRQADTRTPFDQALGYAAHIKTAKWILLSNYDEFRLYNYKKKTDYISFNAADLSNIETLKCFMLVFSKKSHLETDYIKRMQKESLVVEQKLEKNFYKLYHETRLMLLTELEENNGFDRVKAVHYAQLILNRYMFICFAEDIGLLPAQISTETISNPIKSRRLRDNRIWQELNDLFLDINDGRNYDYNKVYGYNGGLFQEDLDFIKIRDVVEDQSFFQDAYQKYNFEDYEKSIDHLLKPYGNKVNPIYRNMLTISSFDFSSELDVNILGHIFENSIGDIEELKEDAKGRRKKEGVFYTPEYITDYICRNTIIPYLSKSGKVNTVKKLIDEYWGPEIEELDQKVKEIKIVDPACGSGAFLNKAADVLVEIHDSIHKCKYKEDKTLMPYFDSISKRREILLDNIYGVDLNEESVEITKLAFFLKVAKSKMKLPNLDNNIKCGNSIVDDPDYTDKPFKWNEEFKEIFETDGFDIVIGNPPYVRQELIKEIKPYLKDKYDVYTGIADLYVYFFEKGLEILKEKGKLGYISSNKFIKANYGKNLRKFILENSDFEMYFDHTYSNIFEDANTYPSIFILKKGKFNKENKVLVNDTFEVEELRLHNTSWGFEKPEILNLRDKIDRKGTKLKEVNGLNFYRGILTGYNEAFIIDKKTKHKLINEDKRNAEIIKPILRGKDIKRWKIDYKEKYLIFTRRGIDINKYPTIKEHLSSFKERLRPKNEGQTIGRKSGDYQWYEMQDTISYYKEFEKEKLIYPNISARLFATFSDEGIYPLDTCYFITSDDINIKFLEILLSSKVLNFAFKFLGTPLRGNHFKLSKVFIEQLPIYPATPEQQKPFIGKADHMLQLNKELINEINSFKDWLKYTYKIEKFSKKLDKYYELSLDEFLSELEKKKVDTKSRDNYTTLKKEFEVSLNKIKPLIYKIEETDDEIDQMVYELYGLSNEEIGIIEESLN